MRNAACAEVRCYIRRWVLLQLNLEFGVDRVILRAEGVSPNDLIAKYVHRLFERADFRKRVTDGHGEFMPEIILVEVLDSSKIC